MAYTKHIANRGDIKMLVQPGTDVKDPRAQCVLDTPSRGESEPMLIQKALKWGYWEEVSSPKVVLVAGD